MNRSKLKTNPTTFALVLIAGAMCILSSGCSGPKANTDSVAAADTLPLAARIDRLDGEVGVDRQSDGQDTGQNQSDTDWGKAGINTPVSVGSRIYVKEKSRAAIAFSGRNYACLNPRTSLDVLSLSQRRTQLALRDGSGVFDVGALAPEELFEVATPNGAVDFQPGLYQVGLDEGGNTLVSVLNGVAQVVGLGGSGQVGRGQLLTFGAGEGGEDAYLSELDPTVCGRITNDYYAYRYPKIYDGRYSDYQRFQDDRYYDDPYRRSTSFQYIPDDAEVAGLDDLDDYGDWQEVPGQGHAWCPRVSSDWAPYRDGSWYDDQPLGLTWVSNERWGWAPYHYGRWTNFNQRWYWVPGEIVSRPVYAPALVAFVPFDRDDRVGWVALGPGDPYVPRYYDRDYQPRYIGSTTYITKNVSVTRIVNYNVPGAVTVVRTTEFTRGVTPRNAVIADQELLARSRPLLDPYADARLRELAPDFRSQRPRVRLTEGANRVSNREVITSRDPVRPAVIAAESPKAFKNRSVPEADGKRKLKIDNSGQTVGAIRPSGLPESSLNPRGANQTMTDQERKARIDALTEQVARGDKSAKRERRQLLDQQQAQEKVERRQARQTDETQHQQQKQELRAARKASQQQPVETQKQESQKQELRAARKAAQQQPALQEQQKRELKAARKAAQQQPPVQQQQRQELKAARKAARQRPPVQQQQPTVQQQQQKQEVRAARKAAQQQKPPEQPGSSRAEKKAEKARKKNENPN